MFLKMLFWRRWDYKKLYKSFAFLFGIIAVLLILLKILVYDNALGQNFLKLANFPLTAFIFTSFSGIIMPGAVGRTYSYLEFLGLYIPYYIFIY